MDRPALPRRPAWALPALALLAAPALIAKPAAPPAAPAPSARLVVSADGREVVDARARLAWARCIEGPSWNGKTCAGRPQLMHLAQARHHASERRQREHLRWRLPRAAELHRLLPRSLDNPGLDATLFPAAPPDWHWTSTVNTEMASVNPYNYGNVMKGRVTAAGPQPFAQGWAVNLADGEARGDVPRESRLAVRLVRDLD